MDAIDMRLQPSAGLGDYSEFQRRQLDEAARIANASSIMVNQNKIVLIRTDDRTHRLIVEIVDRTSGQVVEQIPQASLFRLVNQRRRL